MITADCRYLYLNRSGNGQEALRTDIAVSPSVTKCEMEEKQKAVDDLGLIYDI